MRRAVLSAAFAVWALCAGTAAALTCLPPSVERAFSAAHAAPEIYLPVLGTFTGFARRSDSESLNGLDRRFRARFEGHVLTSSGSGRVLQAEVGVAELCLGPWCPAFPPDVPVLTFLERGTSGYRFRVDACHGNYFAEPSAEQVETLQDCLKTMDCGEG